MPVGAGFIPARIGENKKMTEHKKLQPEIRFAGFTDDWEQRKLGDICNITTGKLDANAMVENGKYDFFTSGIKKYKIDHYAFLGPALTIAGNGATVGYMHYADGFFNAYQRTYVLTELLGDRTFLFSTINRKLQKKIQQEARAGNIPYIVLDMLTELDIYLPSLEEQTQIGNFFKQLDDTISLHQRTLEKYQKLKISYLEKMFPKENELYPELRFPNFTDAWEQRKLGEVVERITRKNLNLESRLPLTISAQDGLISQTEFFDKQVASKNISGYYLIENGEFAYNKSYSNGYPWGAIKRLDKYKNGVLSTLYIVFKPIDVDSQFLVSYFDTTFWHSEIAEIAVEGARNHGLLNIPVMDFFRIKIKIPKSKEEQTQIGNFFKQLDDTISLHQREVEKYKKIKQSYLEKMFI